MYEEIQEKERAYRVLFQFAKDELNIEKDEEVLDVIERQFHQKKHKVDLTFVYSSPLAQEYHDRRTQEKKYRKFPLIAYAEEFGTVKKILKDSKQQIGYRKICGTQTNLQEVLSEGTKALHFSGHGLRNERKIYSQQGFGHLQGRGDILVLEDELGQPQYFCQKDLETMLGKKPTVEFVFVASCHSELIGEAFFKAGAKHVICIKQEHPIMDAA